MNFDTLKDWALNLNAIGLAIGIFVTPIAFTIAIIMRVRWNRRMRDVENNP